MNFLTDIIIDGRIASITRSMIVIIGSFYNGIFESNNYSFAAILLSITDPSSSHSCFLSAGTMIAIATDAQYVIPALRCNK